MVVQGEPKDKKSAKNKVSTASRVLDFVKLESEEVIGGGGHDYVPRIKKSKVKQGGFFCISLHKDKAVADVETNLSAFVKTGSFAETWSPFKPLSPYKSTSKYSKSSPLLFDSDSDAYESSFINDDSPSEHSTPTTLEKLERRAAKKKKPKRVISETPTPKAAKGKGKIDFMDSDDELGIPSSSAAVARTPPVVPSIPVIELD